MPCRHSANGLTLCTGSLGAGPTNDVPAIAKRFASRINFVHLRNVAKEPDGSFMEADHLGGDTDMVAVVDVLLQSRSAAGRGALGWRLPSAPIMATNFSTMSARAASPAIRRSGG